MVRSSTVREQLFTEQDRAELLALAVFRDGRCPLCGGRLEDCTSHEDTGPAFAASYTVCRATAAILEQQRALTGNGKKRRPNAPAYLWSAAIRKG